MGFYLKNVTFNHSIRKVTYDFLFDLLVNFPHNVWSGNNPENVEIWHEKIIRSKFKHYIRDLKGV